MTRAIALGNAVPKGSGHNSAERKNIMNELIIIGIVSMFFTVACLFAAIIENFGTICRFIKAVVEVIGERIFKAQTKYYKRKQRKRSKKMNKYYYMKD